MKRLALLLLMAAQVVSIIACAATAIDPPAMPMPLVFPPEQGEALILPTHAVDGDTVDGYFLVRSRFRLNGINAPEAEGKSKAEGLASKAALAKILPSVPVKAVLHGREKYGRLLADIFTADGKSLSQVQVEGGHAKAWDGKGERP